MLVKSVLKDARCLVTGGAGFLGSEVVRQLSLNGTHVTVLDNFSSGKVDYIKGLRNVEIIAGDICSRDTVAKCAKDHDFIIHMAALPFIPDSYYYPDEFFKINVMGTVTVLWEAVKSKSIERFVHVSSSEVYGTAKYVPMDEEHPTLPHSTYAVSKLAADRAAFTIQKEHDFPVVIIRPFNSYGPNITQPYIVPEIASQLLMGNTHIRLGNIESSRDLTYVSDTARGIIAALTTDKGIGETINLGSGKAVKIKELASIMAKILHRDIKIEIDSTRLRPYDVDTLVCDNRKAKKLLDWTPEVPLAKGLGTVLEWISKNGVSFKAPFRGWPTVYRQNSKT